MCIQPQLASMTALLVLLAIPSFAMQPAYDPPVEIIPETVWLDELEVGKATTGWGTAKRNMSIIGKHLRINGKSYERGMGTHAVSRLRIQLDGGSLSFHALVGVDDGVKGPDSSPKKSSVEFFVLADGRQLWHSGIMRTNDDAKPVDIDVRDVQMLTLLVSGGEDGITFDHADWVNARLEVTSSTPIVREPYRTGPYLLTPPSKPQPRLTGAKVFGVRPGSPFLFRVTATGDRPMVFAAEKLPEGLQLDPRTGQITGRLLTRGKHHVQLAATNSQGTAERDFRIIVGDSICLTPPMGWNSWNCWGCEVNEQKVRAAAQAMVDSGLANHGWTYINIDDCWMRQKGAKNPSFGGPVRDANGHLIPNKRFPDMKGLCDTIHGLGLKAGIYNSPGPTTCQLGAGSYQHEQQDAEQLAEWGFDYLKYDWCGYSKIAKNPNLSQLKAPYTLMRKKLDRVDRDIVYSLCQYGMGQVWQWGQDAGGNCWRTSNDIRDTWDSMAGIGFSQDLFSPFAGPGHWNDPDMLVVGNVGWGPNLRPSRLTPDEQYTHLSLWSLLSAPLLIGCPLDQLDPFTLNLLTNDEVLELNQDPLGKQAVPVSKTSTSQVWVKRLEDDSLAVGLFNLDAEKQQQITIDWELLGIEGNQRVRDLWRQQNIGVRSERFSAMVRPHGVILLRITTQ